MKLGTPKYGGAVELNPPRTTTASASFGVGHHPHHSAAFGTGLSTQFMGGYASALGSTGGGGAGA